MNSWFPQRRSVSWPACEAPDQVGWKRGHGLRNPTHQTLWTCLYLIKDMSFTAMRSMLAAVDEDRVIYACAMYIQLQLSAGI